MAQKVVQQMDCSGSFGRWLKQRRKALDMTQHDLAQRVGCSIETIRKIEADIRRPSHQIAGYLAEQMAIPIEERAEFVQWSRSPRPAGSLPGSPPAAGSTPEPPSQPLTHLPVAPTPLIGRDQNSALVRDYLQRDTVRLLTLTGPPGIGKTSLALQVAMDLHSTFADGVSFVALASIAVSRLVASAIAKSLAIQEAVGLPLNERLKLALREKHMLLVLDNFEHVLDAAPLLAELLAACPRLKLLVTSRAMLRIRGEQEYPVLPLAVPDLDPLPPQGELARYPSVALFVARTQAVKPDFALTNENMAAVAAICVRLEGVPLAIELAAARGKLFSPTALLARLDPCLPMLTVGACDMPARHQTLRDAIAWSYDLLEADEQALFRYLGMFVGGCTLEAAEAVFTNVRMEHETMRSDQEGGQAPCTILHIVEALIDKSLLRQKQGVDDEPRFVMLEMIREYAQEQLAISGEADIVRRCHADFFLAFMEAAEPMLQGEQQRAWQEQLEDEHDNLRAALRSTLDSGAADKALRLSAALWRFWRVRGYLSEGRYWLDAALAAGAGQPAPAHAQALDGAGLLARDQGDYQQAQALHQQSLALYQELGDQRGIAESLDNLGHVAWAQGEYGQALGFFERSLVLYSALGSKQQMASTLIGMANIAWSLDDGQRAEALFQQSLALCREINNREHAAWSLAGLGTVALSRSDDRQAIELFEEGLALFRDISHNRGIAWILHGLGNVARAQSDYAQARARYEESLALQRMLGDKHGIALALYNLGLTTRCQGDGAHAQACYTESLALFRELDNTRHIALVLDSLGDVASDQSHTEQ